MINMIQKNKNHDNHLINKIMVQTNKSFNQKNQSSGRCLKII